jgi:hypothetical protein
MCTHWRSHLGYHFAVQEWIRLQEELQHRRASGAGASAPRPTLADLLLPPALMLQATRPEDKIFALHGICKRLGYAMQAPDYQKPLGTVYAEAAREIIYSDRAGLDRLLRCACESSGWEQGIPSWVPNFAGCIREWSPATPPHMFAHDRRDTMPAGNSTCQFAFSADGHAISIKGRRLGTVCAVGRPWVVDNSATMLTGARSMMPTDNNSILCLLESLESWLEIAEGLGEAPREHSAPAELLLAQVMAEDTMPVPPSPELLRDIAQAISTLVVSWRSNTDPSRLILAEPQDYPEELVQIGDCFLSREAHAAIGQINGMVWKTVFRTVAGYLAAGTHSVQDGDIIVIFHGCSMPAALRPWGDRFRYISPAYVSGVMKGAFWNTSVGTDDEWFNCV